MTHAAWIAETQADIPRWKVLEEFCLTRAEQCRDAYDRYGEDWWTWQATRAQEHAERCAEFVKQLQEEDR